MKSLRCMQVVIRYWQTVSELLYHLYMVLIRGLEIKHCSLQWSFYFIQLDKILVIFCFFLILVLFSFYHHTMKPYMNYDVGYWDMVIVCDHQLSEAVAQWSCCLKPLACIQLDWLLSLIKHGNQHWPLAWSAFQYHLI